jgi:hypothetical protein
MVAIHSSFVSFGRYACPDGKSIALHHWSGSLWTMAADVG